MELLDDKGSELIRGLVKNAGFATSEAEGFVPKAVSAAIEVVQGSGVDLSSLLSNGGSDSAAGRGGAFGGIGKLAGSFFKK